jgi:hypothetical protein
MTEKKNEAISRRAVLRKLGLGTAVFVAPMVVTVSEAKANGKKRSRRSRATRKEKSGKRYTGKSSNYSSHYDNGHGDPAFN